MRKLILIFLIILFPVFIPCQAKQAKSTWTPDLSIDYKTINSVEVSPDGTKTLIRYLERNKNFKTISRFCIISNETKETLFISDEGENYLEVKWSPKGKWISFIRSKKDGFVLAITPSDKFNPLIVHNFTLQSHLSSHQWAPDEKKISFVLSFPIRSNTSILPNLEDNQVAMEMGIKKSVERLAMIRINPESKEFSAPSFLTALSFSVMHEEDLKKCTYAWAPDSRFIAFSFVPVEEKNSYKEMRLAIVDINTAKIETISPQDVIFNPQFSPDGKSLAFVIGAPPHPGSPIKQDEIMLTNLQVCLLNLKDHTRKYLAKTPNESPQILGWEPEGSNLLIVEDDHTRTAIYSLPISGKPYVPLSTKEVGELQSVYLNSTGTHISFIGEDFWLPPEAYVASLKSFTPLKVSNFHEELLNLPKFKTEIITWSSFDGKMIEGIITYPFDYKEGNAVPLVVRLHGGPPIAWKRKFLGLAYGVPPSAASLATHGFAVFSPNVRGSDGYGAEFRQAIYQDWANGPFQDVMTGIDLLIKKGVADPEKLVISGSSYGGYLTTWATTQTNRFKAAIVFAGDVDLIAAVTNASTGALMRSYFGGEFWQNPTLWLHESPIMHVQNIKTPILIQHGTKDMNVKMEQGYELYFALKKRNVPIEMIVYKNQGHGLRDQTVITSANATLAWLKKYVLSSKDVSSTP